MLCRDCALWGPSEDEGSNDESDVALGIRDIGSSGSLWSHGLRAASEGTHNILENNEFARMFGQLSWPDPWPDAAQSGVYVMFDGTMKQILYVGSSRKLGLPLYQWFGPRYGSRSDFQGLRAHWKQKPDCLVTFSTTRVFHATSLERHLLQELDPVENMDLGLPDSERRIRAMLGAGTDVNEYLMCSNGVLRRHVYG